MKKVFLFAIAILFFNSCQNDEATSADSSFAMKSASADYSGYPATVQTVSGNITTNTTWTNDRVWEVSGVVRVIGAKLTIQPGTFIKAKVLGSGVATGVLVITKTGQIDAQGTAASPVIFTSFNLLDGNAATKATPGDFGGLVLLGDAQVNTGVTTNVIEGLGDQPNPSDFYYGGTNNAHNAGALNYVRIEFAGRILDATTGVEINGLTLGGVGSGTVIDHVQVSYGRDDSFEFFGGTVNASHLVSFAPDDDNFDFDFGYTGSITKAIAIADKDSTHSLSGGNPDSNGIELDNNATGTSTAIITRPVISQLSIIGASSSTNAALYENAIHVRRLGQINLSNVTVTGYLTGIRWESPSLPANSTWSLLSVHGFTNPVLPVGTALGFGSTTSTVSPATAWGLTQPFFNDGTLNFAGATGAFKTEANWTNTWTKFTNF
ncbi:hypothetical protein ACHRV5_03515 [Flavobacterium sp. FlaQc-52]|jgi:hypothetical protein|uniref:T9SS C-terminal target domain-containing protein n=1 Tax=Flavobacterium cupriresistens TaxID=2893885 RepID=A0ABU4RI76_9FLAO|nr:MULTISPECIES: hypothetical protein [unclassified Flavobacterium]MDX6191658.1 hypothetical protein [Flavobacterium sp. Fl-318]UFH41602.1 hypothetical protein LNP23_17515 [Flavobacterium sp. F-323]